MNRGGVLPAADTLQYMFARWSERQRRLWEQKISDPNLVGHGQNGTILRLQIFYWYNLILFAF